jgi:hypothetical protein
MLLALACVVALVVNIVEGNGLYRVLLSILCAAFFVSAANWALQLRKTVRKWDLAVAERARLSS